MINMEMTATIVTKTLLDEIIDGLDSLQLDSCNDLLRGYIEVKTKLVADRKAIGDAGVWVYPVHPILTYALQHAEELQTKIRKLG